MSIISIKKKNGAIHLDGNVYFLMGSFFFLLLFGGAYLSTRNLIHSLIFSITFTFFILVITALIEHFGKKRHKSIHSSSVFQNFYSTGYLSEKIGEYHGLITQEKSRTIRCYYDWSRLSKFPPCFGNIVFNIYYQPLINNMEELDVDEERIEHLNTRFGSKGKVGSYIRFDVDRVTLGMSFNPWMKPTRFKNKIDKIINILEAENLSPININDERFKEQREKGWFLPNTQLIWEWQEQQEKNNANTSNE